MCTRLVYSLDVVEHFPETVLAIAEHARVVRKGSLVLTTTPHLSVITSLRYMMYLLKGEHSLGTFEEIRGRSMKLGAMKS